MLAAGLLLAPGAGATAANNLRPDSAFAISATGLLKVRATPSVNASDGFAQASLAQLKLPALAQAHLLNARAGSGEARSSIGDLSIGLGLGKPVLTASAVEATCASGKVSSSLAKAVLGDIELPVQAPPNTAVRVPELASVVLNKQVTHEDGTVTVTALSISVDNLQTLDLGSATCASVRSGTVPTSEPTTSEPTTSRSSDGTAPRPTPVRAHLDVTG